MKVKSINGYEFFEDDVDVINSTVTPGRGVNPSGKSSIEGAFSETTFSYSVVDLIAGLRYDRFKLEGEGSVAAGNPVGLPAGPYALDREEGRFNPKVTLAATPLAWFQPYVTYSESMRAPTVNETLTGGQHPAFGPPQQFFPNPFLDPEIQKGWEFGFNVRYDGLAVSQDRFRLKADYYTQDVENYIIGVSNPATGASVFVNVPGTSQVQGIEVESTYDARFLFAGVAYTYTDSDLPSQTNGFGAQSFLPDHVLTLTGGLRFFNEKLETGARWHSVSESFIGLVNVAAGQSPYVEPYDLLDLFASYKMDSGLDLGFTMTNVFDKAYTPELTTPATNFTGELGRATNGTVHGARSLLSGPRAENKRRSGTGGASCRCPRYMKAAFAFKFGRRSQPMTMYIAMNRFKVLKDCAQDFENVWFSRESYLHEMPGFVSSTCCKGPEREDHVLYSSHTVWRSYADFDALDQVGGIPQGARARWKQQ